MTGPVSVDMPDSPTKSGGDRKSRADKQWRPNLRQILDLGFPLNAADQVSIKIRVDSKDGCGGNTWPAGETLASYLVRKGPQYVRGKNVLELGSGTGLTGLVVAKLGAANVWITDQSPMVSLMHENVAMNSLECAVNVAELNWGQPIPVAIQQPVDLLLAADCVYIEETFPLLVQTLRALVGLETEVLFCYAKRRKADKRFWVQLSKFFSWEEICVDEDTPSNSPAPVFLYRLSLLTK